MADGKFYLGKEISPQDNSLSDQAYSYKTDHLTTHGMVFGMTGSGKTGLCLDILEEAISEDIPLIIIDPKGDLSNLSLMFPDFKPEDFKPWISLNEASVKGKTVDQYAGDIALKWKAGVESWGLRSQDMQNIKNKANIRIFTPGSSAGEKISIMEGFKKPETNFEDDEEGMIEKIQNSVSALLALLNVDNDPLNSKPHILISNIIEYYWKLGRSVSIEELIINIQKPPIKKLGVFDIDQLINEKERTDLSLKINNIVASSSFRFWTSGMPLSAETLFRRENNKIPVNIFYIAHLSDNERMFLVSLLLNEIVYWMRRQPGSPNLKYLLYMDEIFGYLPPYPKNPPSKKPFLLLLKQARAFGLGVVLATQNPKDIDYKAITNMGTWFIGKLQAEGDRERVLEGLEGVTIDSGDKQTMDRSKLKEMITSLKTRQFLVKNIHSSGIKSFQTRWAMSYLAGPLTKNQIKNLNSQTKSSFVPQLETHIPQQIDNQSQSQILPQSHLLPYAPKTEVPIEYLYDISNATGKYYSPTLYFDSEVIFDESRLGLYIRKNYYISLPIDESFNWHDANTSEKPLLFSTLPNENIKSFEPFQQKLNYTIFNRLQTALKNHLFSSLSLDLYKNSELNIVSKGDESNDAFTLRCRDIVEKMIDKEVEKKRSYYESRIERFQDRIEQEIIKIDKLESEHKFKRTEEYISAGESILGFLMGGKSGMRRGLSSAARRRRMTSSAANRVKMGKTKLSQLEEDIQQLQEELEDKIAEIEDTFYEKANKIEPYKVRLEKNDIIISRISILWKIVS